jgi:hypothetical protein
VFATLLDEGRYHGSIRTMYRLLAAHCRAAIWTEAHRQSGWNEGAGLFYVGRA